MSTDGIYPLWLSENQQRVWQLQLRQPCSAQVPQDSVTRFLSLREFAVPYAVREITQERTVVLEKRSKRG